MLVKEFHTFMIIKYMGISHLIINSQPIEAEKQKKRSREVNKAKNGGGDFSH